MAAGGGDEKIITIRGGKECYDHSSKLLEELGFPRGLLPLKDLEECGMAAGSGFIWMKQKSEYEHFFRSTNSLVRYDREVSAFVEKGKMTKMKGIKSRQFLLWVPIVEMSVSNHKVFFKTPLEIGRSFPVSAFLDDHHHHDDKSKDHKK
ncbi:hypothetical protein M569_12749 [Genlisea aurea]|uniref:DUF538 family protein n=1 Tax=Genlisea aurea TaxID=192259 RepID=S8C5G2_9LAMI|nr:hypothetical protein M569_12749 [Genlisea aurea]